MADHPTPLADELDQARDLAVLADPQQLELIRDQVPDRNARVAVEVAERRGRGRPAGSRNRRNTKFRDQILALGPHPAIALQRAYSTPVETLAAQLDCTKLEAATLAIRAATELLPYIEGKQPVTVDLREKHDVVLIMAGAPGVGADQLDAIADQVRNGDDDAIDWSGVTIDGDRIVDASE